MRCSPTTLASTDRPLLSLLSLSRSHKSSESNIQAMHGLDDTALSLVSSIFFNRTSSNTHTHTRRQSNQDRYLGSMAPRPPSNFSSCADLPARIQRVPSFGVSFFFFFWPRIRDLVRGRVFGRAVWIIHWGINSGWEARRDVG